MKQDEHMADDSTGAFELIGRGPEMAEVRRLLPKSRLLTLTGAGGVGKTRLARRAAQTLRGWFPGGVTFVELAALEDADLLETAVAAALGLRDTGRHAMPVLVDHLSDKRMLIVLDNCEHLLQECADLADRLLRGAPRLRILVTSRQRLGIAGEAVLAVPALPVPRADATVGDISRSEAVRLFTERAARARPGFAVDDANALAVARLSQRLDGLPLAIELAAVRLRTMPLEELVRKLDDRFDLLAGHGAAALPRHETLRATMDWSFELCSPGERLLWSRLSIFPGGVDLETAESVCGGDGVPPEDVFDLLAGLVDKSVLATERSDRGIRYRMLDSIRAYGRERLASAGERGLYDRFRDHYRRLAERHRVDRLVPDQLERHQVTLRELPNLRAALDLCFRRPGDAPAGLEIAYALWAHWLLVGALYEARHWLGRALKLVTQPCAIRAKALWTDTFFAVTQDDLTGAMQRTEQCRAVAERSGDETAVAFALQASGLIALSTGDTQRGFELMDDARARHLARGDVHDAALNLYYCAQWAVTQLPDRADPLAAELLALSEAHNAPLFETYALVTLGFSAWRRGDPRETEARMRKAATVFVVISDRFGLIQCLEPLAWTASEKGRHERAARLLGAAGRLWQSLDVPPIDLQQLAWAHQDCDARTRRELGPRAFAAAYHAGARLSLERAVAYALEDDRGGDDGAAPAEQPRTE